MTVDENSGEIIVVRDDSIYYYGANGRGPSYAYEGPKQLVKTFKQYVAVVSPPQAPSPSRSSALRAFVGGRAEDIFNPSSFALIDTDLKYVAYTETLTSQVRAVFVEWGDLFLLTSDGKVHHDYSISNWLC